MHFLSSQFLIFLLFKAEGAVEEELQLIYSVLVLLILRVAEGEVELLGLNCLAWLLEEVEVELLDLNCLAWLLEEGEVELSDLNCLA